MLSHRLTPSRHETLEEHRSLREAVEQARAVLARGRATRAMVVEMLQELSAKLLEHFDHEESCGYFTGILKLAPHLAIRAETLLGQHAEMADLLVSLLDGPTVGESSRAWWRRVDASYARFAALFLSHEAGENALLQEVWGDDLGSGD